MKSTSDEDVHKAVVSFLREAKGILTRGGDIKIRRRRSD